MTSRRTFLKQNSLAAAGVRVALAAPFVMTPARSAPAAPAAPVADTATCSTRIASAVESCTP
ncbi:MAG: hypothetical protein LAQ69_08690 [Acidobacteriia bacterium]|nr:hypothetical protein [Terriglobia bacterium]